MENSFVKIGSFTPSIKVADVKHNAIKILEGINEGEKKGLSLLVFPELCLTGSTCGDLFFSDTLLNSAKNALVRIAKETAGKKLLAFIGMPIKHNGFLYNVAVGVSNGAILGIVPKNFSYGVDELNQKRYFSVFDDTDYIRFQDFLDDAEGQFVPFSNKILFCDENNEKLKIGVVVGNDSYSSLSDFYVKARNGARVIVNLSAEREFLGRIEERINNSRSVSEKCVCAYLTANAGDGESTTDGVYSGHSVICEKGELLSQTLPFNNGYNIADVDIDYIDAQRSIIFNNRNFSNDENYLLVGFQSSNKNFKIEREYYKTPFIKSGEEELLLSIQAEGLKKRIEHTNAKKIVIGLSGGLDSTLAVLVCVKAMSKLNRPIKDVLAFTMPCFGTTSRTLDNSIKLAKALGVTIKKVDISKSVIRHLKDIGHDGKTLDATYENAQARERTQVLMDMANRHGGLVVGTGDLSELALGWATYNGDHMSMYGVNGSIPKTLVKHLVWDYANKSKGKLKSVLLDILDTPVSPELLPTDNSEIKQKTEDIVGPYILHDFFMYHLLCRLSSPKKVYEISVKTFEKEFGAETILKWLKTFVKRFFTQQFKRSCLPDGVKVTEISLSPRCGLSMPSDAVSSIWLDELENL